MCGYIELRPSQASTGSLFQLQGFVLPQPSGKGTSVRNIQAFHVCNIEERKRYVLLLNITLKIKIIKLATKKWKRCSTNQRYNLVITFKW